MDQYLFGGRWITAKVARAQLMGAAKILANSANSVDRDAANLMAKKWQAVASRPSLFLEVMDRATMLRLADTARL